MWRSSSGNRFSIPNSGAGMNFDIVLTRPRGTKKIFTGRWIEGMEGTRFRYGNGLVATFNRDDPDRIRVLDRAGGVSYWRRSRAASLALSYAGTWRSTTGNRFIVPVSRGPFDVILVRPDGRKQVFPARWVPGMEGTQFEYGGNTVTFNMRRPYKLRVTHQRGVSWWTRVR